MQLPPNARSECLPNFTNFWDPGWVNFCEERAQGSEVDLGVQVHSCTGRAFPIIPCTSRPFPRRSPRGLSKARPSNAVMQLVETRYQAVERGERRGVWEACV